MLVKKVRKHCIVCKELKEVDKYGECSECWAKATFEKRFWEREVKTR